MTSRLRSVAIASALATVAAVSIAGPASGVTGDGSGYAAAVQGNAGALSVQATGTGLLGSTLAAALAPLAAALNSVASSAAATVVNGLANAGYSAGAQGSSQPPPASGFPASCSSGGWNATNCYSATSGGSSSAAGVLSLNLNAVQGYATGDSTGYYAAARTASPTLSTVGVSVGSLGVVTSSASCLADGTCTAASAVTGASLFGGLIRVQTAAGGSAPLQFSLDGGATWSNVSSLTVPITVSGSAITLSADGSLLHIRVGIGLSQLLSSLGLGGLLTSLTGLDTSSTSVYLTVTLASGRSTASGASGWGLGVGVDLAGSVTIAQSSLLSGLLGSASITIPSGITSDPSGLGNIATLQLAYSAATAGSATTHRPTWYPPGLI